MKETETIMEILAAYDLTQSFRDAAALVGCAPNTVIRYVRARDAVSVELAWRGAQAAAGLGEVVYAVTALDVGDRVLPALVAQAAATPPA